jgi:hypothetical protein
MTIQISITLDDWVYNEYLKEKKNRSALIQEALIKLDFANKEKVLKDALKSSNTDLGTKLRLVITYSILKFKTRWL